MTHILMSQQHTMRIPMCLYLGPCFLFAFLQVADLPKVLHKLQQVQMRPDAHAFQQLQQSLLHLLQLREVFVQLLASAVDDAAQGPQDDSVPTWGSTSIPYKVWVTLVSATRSAAMHIFARSLLHTHMLQIRRPKHAISRHSAAEHKGSHLCPFLRMASSRYFAIFAREPQRLVLSTFQVSYLHCFSSAEMDPATKSLRAAHQAQTIITSIANEIHTCSASNLVLGD